MERTITEEATGAPITRAYVEVLPLGRDYLLDAPMRFSSAYAVTDETGRYVISYVPEGSYLLAVYADGAFAYYQNASTASAATPFSVTGGSTTSVDAALSVRNEGEGVVRGRVEVNLTLGSATATGVDGEPAPVPQTVALLGNYPNPFNPETVIRFQLPGETHVTVQVFDVLGRHVATLTDRRYGAGQHEVRWSARDERGQPLSSGIYFYRLEAESAVQSKAMLLLR